jgi:hypothetical protein
MPLLIKINLHFSVNIYCLFKLAVVRRGREIVKLLIYE